MKNISFRLLIISIIVIAFTFLAAAFWDTLGLAGDTIPLAISIIITFGISIAGMMIGFIDIRSNKSAKTWIGIIGNIIVILLFFCMIFYAMSTFNDARY